MENHLPNIFALEAHTLLAQLVLLVTLEADSGS